MLLFKKKDLLVVISKSGETVQFTKPLKDILKYQHRYNYKFKMYENGKVTVADDYIIEGDTLTVLFGSASVSYTSEGATYTEGSGGEGGGSGCECKNLVITVTLDPETQQPSFSANLPYNELDTITGGYTIIPETGNINMLATVIQQTAYKELKFLGYNITNLNMPTYLTLRYYPNGNIVAPTE